ncbi:MBL fold metallo-hydrolase [Egbenema bharatensis]|uniref:MBL fold metallo-hydrolase n=1 Tax=Egbenema bharatensis TaxID=3463334 RepID=UPI003A892036
MQSPTLFEARRVTTETYILPAYLPVPSAGILPVNAFLVKATQPLLVDTGLASLKADFMNTLSQLIHPEDLRWIWLTHVDPDHVGNLVDVLNAAPHAHVITTFLGMGKLGLLQLPLDRIYLLNPGQSMNLGDRIITAIKPPCFDAPETTGLFDHSTQTFFSADCFGALMQTPTETAMEIAPHALREGLVNWSMVDAPWLSMVDHQVFNQALSAVQQLDAEWILSSHLPPAAGMVQALIANLQPARHTTPTPGPDQQAFEQMMGKLMTA